MGAWSLTPGLVLLLPQSFHSRQGKAYLFNEVVNVSFGPKEERLMTTGALLVLQRGSGSLDSAWLWTMLDEWL